MKAEFGKYGQRVQIETISEIEKDFYKFLDELHGNKRKLSMLEVTVFFQEKKKQLQEKDND